jgi:hypothetical protein
MGIACTQRIYLNGTPAADLRVGQGVTLYVPQGEYIIGTMATGICDGNAEASLTIQAGQSKSFRVGADQSGSLRFNPPLSSSAVLERRAAGGAGIVATSRKQPDTPTRVVWRMSADAPLGEYVEVAHAASKSDAQAETPRRRATDGAGPSTVTEGDTGLRRRVEDIVAVPPMPTKVLRPAQAESWQASSFIF